MVEIIRTAPHGTAVAITALGVAALGLAAAPVAVRAQPASPAAVVDAFEKVSGVHPGFRRSGAKGICAAGEFVSSGAGARLTTAVHLQPGARVPAVARFSNGGGVPTAPDNAPAVRGLSLAFTLPGNAGHQFVMINTPAFSSSTPDSLMRFLEVRAPAPGATAADPAKIAAANAANPEWMAQINWLRDNPPPASYATAPYFSVNSFIFTNAAGERQHARWTFEPVAGRVGLTAEQRQALSANFLQNELRERAAATPAEWRVLLQLPQPGDLLTNATAIWPADREQVEVGRLRITEATPAGQPGACDRMMFNPVLLPAGIAPSDDPILQLRLPTYAVSLSRRLQ